MQKSKVQYMGVIREGEVDGVTQECALRFSSSPGSLGPSPSPLCAGFCADKQHSVLCTALLGGTHLPQSGSVPPAIIETQFLIFSRKKRKKEAIILHILKALRSLGDHHQIVLLPIIQGRKSLFLI